MIRRYLLKLIHEVFNAYSANIEIKNDPQKEYWRPSRTDAIQLGFDKLSADIIELRGLFKINKDRINTLERRFEGLLEMLGVEIIEDNVHDGYVAVSTRETSLLEHSQKYIEAATVAGEIVALQREILRASKSIIKGVNYRKNP